MRATLSAVVITRNEASRIKACLDALAFADEIVVVDSGSDDDTIAIARTAGARVIQQDWLGYGAQKQFAVAQARHDWVFCVDADEIPTTALRASIEQTLAAPSLFAYRHPRCNRFMGRALRHGEGYPDWSLRLFHREHARWSTDPIHEKVVSDGPVGTLHGDLMHNSEEGIERYLSKQNRYTTLQAEQMFARGKRTGVATMLLSPVLRFVKFYVLKRGFLDGVPGLVHILIGCFNSFSKYAKLIALQRTR
ncbi:MAG: glycosyltransferase family 2 protein [Gammaproteobacteria bacterium]|nr:glycosyltransferase family 2 protein [Gammaproteobacteria bacterium]MCP5137975.1 glycosyltransferase family 2 protein [Gammaproteobacteria bacterium]